MKGLVIIALRSILVFIFLNINYNKKITTQKLP